MPILTDPRLGVEKRQILHSGDAVPLVLEGREIARIAVADLLP